MKVRFFVRGVGIKEGGIMSWNDVKLLLQIFVPIICGIATTVSVWSHGWIFALGIGFVVWFWVAMIIGEHQLN